MGGDHWLFRRRVVDGGERREPQLALIGGVTLLAGFAFLVTPQLLGIPGVPFFFSVNVRYCAARLGLGLILLPLWRPLRSHPSR